MKRSSCLSRVRGFRGASAVETALLLVAIVVMVGAGYRALGRRAAAATGQGTASVASDDDASLEGTAYGRPTSIPAEPEPEPRAPQTRPAPHGKESSVARR